MWGSDDKFRIKIRFGDGYIFSLLCNFELGNHI